jgi:hypothetical protein
MSVAVGAVAVFFVLMGLVGLLSPERIQAPFGTTVVSPDGRSEVRAVYGGFGVAIGALLFVAASTPALRGGVFTTVAVALIGMAAGRIVSALVERPARFYPCWFYCGVEAAMAAVLLVAR